MTWPVVDRLTIAIDSNSMCRIVCVASGGIFEAKGLVAARSATADSGRPRKYYRLTDKGKRRLARDRRQWEAMSVAMGKLGIAGAFELPAR